MDHGFNPPPGHVLLADRTSFVAYRQRVTGNVWFYRRGSVAVSPAEFLSAFGQVVSVVEPIAPGTRLVVDTREAAGDGTPEFEAAVAQCHTQYFSRFARVLVLVRSVVGGMQARRIGDSSHSAVQVVDDEARALAFSAGKG